VGLHKWRSQPSEVRQALNAKRKVPTIDGRALHRLWKSWYKGRKPKRLIRIPRRYQFCSSLNLLEMHYEELAIDSRQLSTQQCPMCYRPFPNHNDLWFHLSTELNCNGQDVTSYGRTEPGHTSIKPLSTTSRLNLIISNLNFVDGCGIEAWLEVSGRLN
jgi:hypothetical protein